MQDNRAAVSPPPPLESTSHYTSSSIVRAFQCYPCVSFTSAFAPICWLWIVWPYQLLTRLPTIVCSIIASIVSSIDLNTLDALARTCRLVHNGLIQYRSVLLTLTLHCRNEEFPVNTEELLRYRARASNWHYMEDSPSYNGKSGSCARDMVDECRKCGHVICRVRLHLRVTRLASPSGLELVSHQC